MTATVTTPLGAAVSRRRPPSALRVLQAVTRAEWTKMRSVRSTMWTLVLTVGVTIGFGVLVGVSQANSWDTVTPAQRLRFDPTSFRLSGLFLAQMAVGVLGVLMITSEYATGQIRATFGATPRRLTVLAAKVATFTVVVLTVGMVACFAAFASGQAIFAGKHIGTSVGDPGVLRAVTGGALYLAAVGALGLGLGTILRRTAGAIAALVGLLLVIPIVTNFLPASWNDHVTRYLPAQAGTAIFRVVPDATSLSPWTGFAVVVGYAIVTLLVGGLLLARRDA